MLLQERSTQKVSKLYGHSTGQLRQVLHVHLTARLMIPYEPKTSEQEVFGLITIKAGEAKKVREVSKVM